MFAKDIIFSLIKCLVFDLGMSFCAMLTQLLLMTSQCDPVIKHLTVVVSEELMVLGNDYL